MRIVLALVLLFAVAANCAEVKKECAKGKAGLKCDQDDVCALKDPCKVDNKKCSLDADFKAVCNCAPGFTGNKCTKRDCSVEEYKGKNLKGKVFVNKEAVKSFEALDKLAKECKLVVDITQSFTRAVAPDDKVTTNETGLYSGNAVVYQLEHSKENLAQTDAEKSKDKKCFADGLKATGLFQQGTNVLYQKKSDDTDVLYEQHGCLFQSKFPKVNAEVLKLVGKWRMIKSVKWNEFLEENLVGWWTRMALKVVVPDIEFKNEGHNWEIYITSTFKNIKTVFTEGVPFKSKSPISGTDTDHVCVRDGVRLLENQTILAKKHRKVVITREVNDKDQFVQTMTINKVVCVRTYKRL